MKFVVLIKSGCSKNGSSIPISFHDSLESAQTKVKEVAGDLVLFYDFDSHEDSLEDGESQTYKLESQKYHKIMKKVMTIPCECDLPCLITIFRMDRGDLIACMFSVTDDNE